MNNANPNAEDEDDEDFDPLGEDDLDGIDLDEDQLDGDEEIPGDALEGEITDGDVPEGAAVFPMIPEELGIHPLLLATIHASVFFDGSDSDVVHAGAAAEAMEYVAGYLQRLQGNDLRRIFEDMETLVGYAKQEKWPKQHVQFLKSFLAENGVARP